MGDSSSIWNRLRELLGGNKPAQQPPPQPIIRPVPAATQTPRITNVPAPAVDLVVGVDFGTCCTKAVIGDPGWKDCSFAVPLTTSRNGISTWLHPTRFGAETNLKMRLMNNPTDEKVRDMVACYLAEVISLSRLWFVTNGPTDYRQREIHWSLNLGFPGKAVQKNTPLATAYREVAMVAVALSSQPEKPSVELAASIRRKTTEIQPFITSSRVQLYPEIAAQLAGYVNSPYRKRGNLLLIDVGAGTLDVSTIILHATRDQEVVSFHFCEVADLGVMRLHEARAKALENTQDGSVKFHLEYDQYGSRPIPDVLKDLVHRSSPLLEDCFRDVSAHFAKEILDVAHGCLGRFHKSQREAHQNANFDPWGNNLRFFLTGGGCRSPFYRNHLANGPLEDRLVNITRWHPERERRLGNRQGLTLEPLPLPDTNKFKNFPSSLRSDFDRLSVAYGLAFGGENLMKITAATHQ